jgi:hypothetical protein
VEIVRRCIAKLLFLPLSLWRLSRSELRVLVILVISRVCDDLCASTSFMRSDIATCAGHVIGVLL